TALPPFPTRRSSDLGHAVEGGQGGLGVHHRDLGHHVADVGGGRRREVEAVQGLGHLALVEGAGAAEAVEGHVVAADVQVDVVGVVAEVHVHEGQVLHQRVVGADHAAVGVDDDVAGAVGIHAGNLDHADRAALDVGEAGDVQQVGIAVRVDVNLVGGAGTVPVVAGHGQGAIRGDQAVVVDAA